MMTHTLKDLEWRGEIAVGIERGSEIEVTGAELGPEQVVGGPGAKASAEAGNGGGFGGAQFGEDNVHREAAHALQTHDLSNWVLGVAGIVVRFLV